MRLLTTQEVADALGISYDATQRRFHRAQLAPVEQIGNSKLWSLAQLRAIKADRRYKAG